MKPNNPFLISGYCGAEYFCDRQAESRTIADAIANGRNITLIAPRRIGKTGLIKHIFEQMRSSEPQAVTLYLDIFSTRTLADFVRLFASTILGQLDSAPQKALARVSQFIKSIRPVMTFDEISGTPKFSIDIATETGAATLKEIFDYLQSADCKCVIAIDEFQQIVQYPEKGIEALLRSFVQFVPNVIFIFAGSKQHLMQQMFMSAKSPFYQSTQIMTLGSIDRAKYYEFAAKFFNARQYPLPQDIFDQIYDHFNGHTWYIQCVLNRLYSYSEPITNSLIFRIIADITAESKYVYENLLAAYPASAVRVLRAIAAEMPVAEPTSGDFISRHRLRAASSVSSALKKLVDNELVYKSDSGYIIYDRFMAEWIRNLGF